MSKVHVTVDRLVISGLDAAARTAFINSLKSELALTLADPGTRAEWAHSHRTPVLRLDRVEFGPGLGGARKLGGQVAKGIGKGLKP